MKAIQIVDLSGPASATALVDAPEPEPAHPLTPGEGVTIEVHAAGVSFPEVLQTRGEYQLKPPLPFIPGSEVAGVVRSVTAGPAPRRPVWAIGWRPSVASAPSPRRPSRRPS